MDVNSVSVAIPKSQSAQFVKRIEEERGFVAKQIDVQGRFHHSDHNMALDKLTGLCSVLPMLRFSQQTCLLVPLRQNDTGEIVGTAHEDLPLHDLALRCILVEKANWHATMTKSVAAITQSPQNRPHVLLLGPIDCIPHSLPLRLIRPWSSNTLTTVQDQRLYAYPQDAIAIVGVSGLFPGSRTPAEFWDTVRAKRSTVGTPSEHRGYHKSESDNAGGAEAFRGNYVTEEGSFDHAFFRKSPREAAYMDPQHRVALQLAYEALESAGYFSPSSQSLNDVGCYIGMSSSDYQDNVNTHAPTAFSFTGTARAFAPGRISHFFGWTGPSLAIDTACSSSGVAIHTAVKAVQTGECTMALAGGLNLMTSPRSHQNLGAASFLSPSGQCRPFDAGADGYCRGEGAGFVLLKRLSSAVANNDRVLGVIAASATNSSQGNRSITVPSAESQSTLYQRVLRAANMHPTQVSYVEAHGTGTQKGDPVECQSIRRVFGGANRRLRIGSVKGNIGHSEAASGVASLIKVVMMLQHRQIPPQASFSYLNPAIGSLKDDNIEVSRVLEPWNETFRAACVNNYGASGSNAAMVVCQPPPVTSAPTHDKFRFPFLITAHSIASLRQYCTKLLHLIESQNQEHGRSDTMLSTVAFQLAQQQKHSHKYRKVFIAKSIDELKLRLQEDIHHTTTAQQDPVVLTFAGQTGNRTRLSEEVYNGSILLRKHLDHCDRTLQSLGLRSLFPYILDTDPVKDLVDLHCMHFSLQYAAAASWIDAGLEINRMVGHSLGQLTALTVAGVLTLRDGLKLVSGRASLIQTKWGPERGCMLSVDADIATVRALMSGDACSGKGHSDIDRKLEIACYNSSRSHVVVGSEAAIAAFEETTRASSIPSKRLAVSHGYHSQLVDSIMDEFSQLVQGIKFHPARIPVEPCANFAGGWNDVTPELVARQSREPVYFSDAIARVEKQLGSSCIWMEAGSGSVGVTMARRALFSGDPVDVSSKHSFVSVRLQIADAVDSLAATTVDLWKRGVSVQFWPFHASQRSLFGDVELPPYQFEMSHHWLPLSSEDRTTQPESNGINAQLLLKHQKSHTCPQLVEFVRLSQVTGAGPQCQAAEFTINQHSDEYCTMVHGRTVLGHTMTPASVWMEAAARAIDTLVPVVASSPSAAVLTQVEQVKLHAPFGRDLEKRLRLTVRRQDSWSQNWTFEVSSHPLDDQEAVKLQASGTIRWLEGHDKSSRLGAHGRMLHRLIDKDRIENLRHDPHASVVQGAFVIKVLGRVASYKDDDFGIRSLTSKGLEAVSKVVMPAIAKPTALKGKAPSKTIFAPSIFDNFLLVAEMHASNLDDCSGDQVYICSGIDAVIPYGLQQGPWTVFSRLERASGGGNQQGSVMSDIFVFNALDNTLAYVILGASFLKVPIHSLQTRLDTMNGAKMKPNRAPYLTMGVQKKEWESISESGFVSTGTTQIDAPAFPFPGKDEVEQQNASDVNDTSAFLVEVKSSVRGLIQEITAGVPIEHIKDGTRLSDVGVDSLSATELGSRIVEVFCVDLPIKNYLEENLSFGRICRDIVSRLSHHPAAPCSPHIDPIVNVLEKNLTLPTPPRSASPGSYTEESSNDEEKKIILQLSNLLAEHLNYPVGSSPSPDTPLGDVGLDSLVAIQLKADMDDLFGKKHSSMIKVNPESTFAGLCAMILPKSSLLGAGETERREDKANSLISGRQHIGANTSNKPQAPENTSSIIMNAPLQLSYVSQNYGSLARESGWAGFYSGVHQKQTELVRAYIIEAFSALGCDLASLNNGDPLPTISYRPKYERLMQLYCQFLEDAGLIFRSGSNSRFVRSAKLLQPEARSADELHHDILVQLPRYSPEHLLLRIIGSRLADCLSGKADPLELLFHQKSSRNLLEDVYVSSPLFATGTKLLGDMLQRLLPHHHPRSGSAKLRILEIGGGTGGTTHHVLAQLLASKLDFTYTFTDISSALIANTKRAFEARYGGSIAGKVEYAVLNVEQPPPASMQESYHLVISSNCIHATKDLRQSCTNIQKLLRADGGMLCLLELTRPQAWLDCVFGLLDGWWRFEDERSYALIDEQRWKGLLLSSGFRHVEWTDDASKESDQFRLIMALNRDVDA